ncbi:hypothetical protein WJX77_001026 [Trebouxia sp. C0004]
MRSTKRSMLSLSWTLCSLDLAVNSCVASPAKILTPKLSKDDLQNKLQALPAWQVNEATTTLTRTFTAKSFVAAVKFFNQVAEVAEEEGHHPDLHLTDYREVRVVLSTHAIGGLSMFDAILAAKIDALSVDYSPKWLQQQAQTSS